MGQYIQNSPVFKEIELKPCPFCGKKAVLRYIDNLVQIVPDGYEIRCPDCNITIFKSCAKWFMFLSPKEREKGMRNIIKRWNRRSGSNEN